MSTRTRKCLSPSCRKWFKPEIDGVTTCSEDCALNYARSHFKRETKRRHRIAKVEYKKTDKSLLKKQVQQIANRLGKLQNMLKGEYNCVTCGKRSPQMDGGHAYPTSTYSPIRYYTLQIRPQCTPCNRWNNGMPREYVKELRGIR